MTNPFQEVATFYERRSALVLVAANLVPLGGVLFFGWSTFEVVFLFWVENIIIGFYNVLKMLTSGLLAGPAVAVGAIFLTAFFIFHYGMFCSGHGFFVIVLLGRGEISLQSDTMFLGAYSVAWRLARTSLGYAMLSLLLSHGFSFYENFLKGREYERVSVQQLMAAPYSRIVVLHLAIIFGGMLVLAFKSPVGILLVLIVMKIVLDLKFHLSERKRNAGAPGDGQSGMSPSGA
jgi:hypothetical protein